MSKKGVREAEKVKIVTAEDAEQWGIADLTEPRMLKVQCQKGVVRSYCQKTGEFTWQKPDKCRNTGHFCIWEESGKGGPKKDGWFTI